MEHYNTVAPTTTRLMRKFITKAFFNGEPHYPYSLQLKMGVLTEKDIEAQVRKGGVLEDVQVFSVNEQGEYVVHMLLPGRILVETVIPIYDVQEFMFNYLEGKIMDFTVKR